MKKALLSLAVAAMALSASAQVYVLGAGEGLSWDFPGLEVPAKTAGVYEFSVKNLSMFKVSTVLASDWDAFNEGAVATGATTFSEAGVLANGGQTLPVEPWGENQVLPFAGDYTITLDLNKMTMTAYAPNGKPTEAPTVYLRGGMNDWGTPSNWQFTYNSKDDLYYFLCQGETMIPSGTEFKIADSNWGGVNFGVATTGDLIPLNTEFVLVHNSGGNMTLNADFSGMIYFKLLSNSDTWVKFVPNEFEYSGVAVVAVADGESVYYNLQGQKVANPERGIFVKVQNGKASKVVL